MTPNYLDKNIKIGLCAPSFGCTTYPYQDRLLKSIENFNKLNIDLYIGDNCFLNKGVAASNSPKARAIEFMDLWKKDIDAIFSVGGGETMLEILLYIDFKELTKYKPKWFVGFSDNTILTYTITINTKIETIYGTNAPGFYSYPFTYNSLDTFRMLKGEKIFKSYGKWQLVEDKTQPFNEYNFDSKTEIKAYNYTKPFTGTLIGGCLDCLEQIRGTKYDNTINYVKDLNDGVVYFLEACDLTPVGIRRVLTSLKYSGWFFNLKGFIIGRSLQFQNNDFNTTCNDAYIDILKEYNVPILLDCDLGHLSPSMPMKCGACATISFENNTLTIEYK